MLQYLRSSVRFLFERKANGSQRRQCNMKKKTRVLIIAAAVAVAVAALALLLGGRFARQSVQCPAREEEHFTATVLDATSGSILVEPDRDSWAARSADQISVALTGFDGAETLSLAAGDVVEIYFDGSIAETYPAQIVSITGLEIIEKQEAAQPVAGSEETIEAQAGGDQPALIRVKGTLYRDSGEIDDVSGRCGVMDGSIAQECDGIPTEDGQSNFGAGYGYQFGRTEDSIEVYIDEEWHIFVAYEIPS
jgi:hypothetical protein